MDCDLLDFELWYEEACASMAQAPSPLPQHLNSYDWEVLLNMFDMPNATCSATAAFHEMAGGSQGLGQDIVASQPSLWHSTQTQLGATPSDHIHDIHFSGPSTVPLQSLSQYSPYNFSARLNAPHSHSHRARNLAAADGGLMMEHANHNVTVGVPTMPASLLLPALPSLLPTPASLPPAPASLPLAPAPLPPAPASLPQPPTIGLLTSTTAESLSSLAGRFGLKDLPQVKLEAKDVLKQSTFDNFFLLSMEARSKKALESLATTVAEYNTKLTQWAKGSKASKDAETIANTIKNLRKKIKDIVRITVLYGYNLHEALATQPQAEIVCIINELLDNNAFLNGSINVGGHLIVVPFGHSTLRYFVKHVLFYNLNFQQYVNDTNRNIGPLLAFIGTLFRWALQELSTARIAMDEGFYNVYTALSSEGSIKKSDIAASTSLLNVLQYPDSDRLRDDGMKPWFKYAASACYIPH
ncbi:hypothetical protein BDR06DRAFT_972593 [Suillus hirtellus]|nr:hypothetical protein BDR06DRAFT_972593 [Suillus hirtellus]